MSSKNIVYAIEVDFTGVDGQTATVTDPNFNFLNGFFRAVTGNLPVIIDSNVFSASLLETFGNLSQRIDISNGGSYATYTTFNFGVVNATGFYDFLETQGIFPEMANLRVWQIIDGTVFPVWAGVIEDLDQDEKRVKFKCIDAAKKIHRQFPPQIVNPFLFGFRNLDGDANAKPVPVVLGRVPECKYLEIKSNISRLLGWFRAGVYSTDGVLASETFGDVGFLIGFDSPRTALTTFDFANAYNLKNPIISIGINSAVVDQFKGLYLRIVRGEGSGTVRRVLGSSASFQTGNLNGVFLNSIELFLDNEIPFELEDNEIYNDIPETEPNQWDPNLSYSIGDYVAVGIEYFRAQSTPPIGENPQLVDGAWKVAKRKKPIFESSTPEYFSVSKSAPIGDIKANPNKNLVRQTQGSFVEFYNASNILLLSQNQVFSQDTINFRRIRPDIANPINGGSEDFRQIISSQAEYRNSNLFNGEFAGVILDKLSLVQNEKAEIFERISDVVSLQVNYGFEGETDGGAVADWISKPFSTILNDVSKLNDDDLSSYIENELIFQVRNPSGANYTEAGKFPIVYTGTPQVQNAHSAQLTLEYNLRGFNNLQDFASIFPYVGLGVTLSRDYQTPEMVFIWIVNLTAISSTGTEIKKSLQITERRSTDLQTGEVPFWLNAPRSLELETEAENFRANLDLSEFGDELNTGEIIDKVILQVEIRQFTQPTTNTAQSRWGLKIYEAGVLGAAEIDLKGFRGGVYGEIWGSTDPVRHPPTNIPNRPGEIIEYLISKYDNGNIDKPSFDQISQIPDYTDIRFSRQILEQKSSRDYILEIAQGALFGIIQSGDGSRSLKGFDYTGEIVSNIFSTDTNILRGSLRPIDLLPISRICSTLTLNYNYTEARSEFLSQIRIRGVENSSFPGFDDNLELFSFTSIIAAFVNSNTQIRIALPDEYDLTPGDILEISNGVQTENLTVTDVGRIIESGIVRLQVTGDSNNSLLGITMPPLNSCKVITGPTWQTYAEGYKLSDYAIAKETWENFRRAYLRIKRENPVPSSVSDSKWIHSDGLETASPDAVLYALRLSRWFSTQKGKITFDIPLEIANTVNLLDFISVSDPLIIPNGINGWVMEKHIRTGENKVEIVVIFKIEPDTPLEDLDELIDPLTPADDVDELIDPNTPADDYDEGIT